MLIVLNNKCHFKKGEFLDYQKELSKIDCKSKMILCPSFLYLTDITLGNISLGSQDVSIYKEGAYTGDVAAVQLKSCHVSYTLVGHCERRKYHQETPDILQKKIRNLLDNDIIPILCIGEEKLSREKNQQLLSLSNDLDQVLSPFSKEEIARLVIAYEPIWAIGTGDTPTIEELDEVFSWLKEKYSQTKTIYGGSVTLENITSLKTVSKIDGFLLGSLSLEPRTLQKVVKILEN